MIMADVFKILFPVVGTLMSFVCFCLLFEGMVPAAVNRCRGVYETRPVRALFLGLALAGPGMFLGIAFLKNVPAPVGQFLGFSVIFFLVSMGILGSAGLSSMIGTRLHTPDDEGQPWRRVLRGGTVLAITFLFPLVGWFLVMPLTLASGLGAAVISMWQRRSSGSIPSDANIGIAGA